MAAAVRDGSLAIAFIFALEFVPRGFKIPDDYHISSFAQTVLSTNQQIIDSTRMEPTGWADVTWPIQKIFGASTVLFNYAVAEPVVALMYNVEKAIRGDFKSAVHLAEENVELLKEHNITYQQQLDKLEPVAQTMVEIIRFVETLNQVLIKENLDRSARVETLQTEVEDIERIDLNKVYEAAKKVADFIQTTLNNPDFIRKLETNEEILTNVSTQLSQCTERLQKLQEIYQEKTAQRSSLWQEAEQLRSQCTDKLNEYTQNALIYQQNQQK